MRDVPKYLMSCPVKRAPPKDWPGGRTNMPDFIGGPNLDSV